MSDATFDLGDPASVLIGLWICARGKSNYVHRLGFDRFAMSRGDLPEQAVTSVSIRSSSVKSISGATRQSRGQVH